MKMIFKLMAAILGLTILLLFSCRENETIQPELGKLVVKMTDAPFPKDSVREARVKIVKIEIAVIDTTKGMSSKQLEQEKEKHKGMVSHGKNNSYLDKETFGKTYLTISTTEQVINLLELSNGITKIITEAHLPSGIYSQVVLYITEATIVTTKGTVYTVKLPSGSTRGIVINIVPTIMIVKGLQTTLLLDVDVNRSFIIREKKKSIFDFPGFEFKPVIRAVNMSECGKLVGKVADEGNKAIENAAVLLLYGNDTITTALTAKSGRCAIIGIPVGNYKVACEKDGYKKPAKIDAKIENDKTTEVNFQLLK
jgi:hypothetical protein